MKVCSSTSERALVSFSLGLGTLLQDFIIGKSKLINMPAVVVLNAVDVDKR